jgi:hypothetical protein
VLDASGAGGRTPTWGQLKPSEVQSLFPNNRYFNKLDEVLSKTSSNLEVLYLECTHMPTDLHIEKYNWTKLRVLRLDRIEIPAIRLKILFEKNQKTLKALALREVRLRSGTWEEIFNLLSESPALDWFFVESLCYISLSPHSLPIMLPIDDPRDIQTTHFPDRGALGRLERSISSRRRQMGLTELGWFRHEQYGR